MNLPFLKRFNKKVLPLYYLVLVLRDEKTQAVIFEEIEGVVRIIGQKEEHFTISVDEISQEELLEKLDKAISGAESSLPENIQTQKTIFGVKESWTEKDQIKKEFLSKLKKVSEELGLTPIGFLVNSQAIAHLLAKEEGAPVSAILTEVNKKSVTVTLLRGGKTIETKSSQIHESIPFTVDTLLKHFDVPEILPSRIIIFNGKEDLSQEFISHTWSKSLPFLHLPQITNLPDGFDAKSVLFGAATQMGFEVLNTEYTGKSTENTEAIRQHKDPVDSVDNSVLSVMKDFGFTKDIDVAKMAPALSFEQEEKEEETQPREEEPKATNKIMIFFELLKGASFGIIGIIKKILLNIPRRKITIFLPIIALLIIALIASYILFAKATITITIEPKITQEEKIVLFSTTSPTAASENIIRGGFVSISEDGSVSTAATGKKAVGDRAKGAVSILSSLPNETTIKKGTIVKSSNGLEFTLDTDVKMASSSGLDDLKSNKANVTANDIGKEYNIPLAGTKFTIGSFDSSQLVAKNDDSFSGGTKKEVTVISKNDQTKLEQELPKQLEEKARENLGKQIDKNKILLPSFTSNSLSKKTFDAKIGDEASQVTLKGTVEYQGIAYDKNDLIVFSKSLLEKDIPSNQQIDYNNIKTSVLDIKNVSDEEVEANLSIKGLLLPRIDENKLKKELKSKSFKTAEDTLYKLDQISNVIISLSPKIPFLPKNLPGREANIKIIIKING